MGSKQSIHDICRVLAVFDGETEQLQDVIELVGFELESFVTQFDVPVESDPEMLDRYAVGPADLDFLRRHLTEEIEFDFTKFGYFIDAAKRE